MNNILIATDYSENAEKALQYAILLGKAYQAKIYIIHTYLPRFVEPGIYANAEIMQQSLNEQHDAYQAKLVPLANQVEEAGLVCEAILELNDVVSGVFDAIEKYDIDLLVMGRTGSGGFLNKLIGSNAAHITAKSTIPVLAIPHQVEKVAIEKILYATQLEFDENHILSQVFEIAHKLKAEVNLTKVNASFEPDIQSDKQFIDQINTAFVKENFVIDTITADSVTEGIFRAAATHQSDLIVLAAHHRNFLSQLIDPSKSKQVIISSHLPVLTFQR
jgi:nucleotide-binding universal stress UspA family protein